MHTPKFHLAPHILTHRAHTFCLSSLSNSSAQHTGHDKLDWLDTQLSSLCTLYKVMICKLTNLLEYKFISFDGTNRICVRKSIKTTKLVQASTIVCSSSAMACWNSTARHARLNSFDTSNVSSRVETWWVKWNLGHSKYGKPIYTLLTTASCTFFFTEDVSASGWYQWYRHQIRCNLQNQTKITFILGIVVILS